MKSIALAMLAITAFAAHAETENFDSTKVGALPDGWEAGVTGKGSPWWAVNADAPRPARRMSWSRSRAGRFHGASRRASRSPMDSSK